MQIYESGLVTGMRNRKIEVSDAFEMIFLMNPIWKIDLTYVIKYIY